MQSTNHYRQINVCCVCVFLLWWSVRVWRRSALPDSAGFHWLPSHTARPLPKAPPLLVFLRFCRPPLPPLSLPLSVYGLWWNREITSKVKCHLVWDLSLLNFGFMCKFDTFPNLNTAISVHLLISALHRHSWVMNRGKKATKNPYKHACFCFDD